MQVKLARRYGVEPLSQSHGENRRLGRPAKTGRYEFKGDSKFNDGSKKKGLRLASANFTATAATKNRSTADSGGITVGLVAGRVGESEGDYAGIMQCGIDCLGRTVGCITGRVAACAVSGATGCVTICGIRDGDHFLNVGVQAGWDGTAGLVAALGCALRI